LECGRYIERNPVRAGIVKDPSEFLWSSYNFYAKGARDSIVTVNPLYPTLGKTPRKRQRIYQKYINEERPYEIVLDKAIVST
jgi:putative transposase